MLSKEQWDEQFTIALSKLSGRVNFDLVPSEEQDENNSSLRPSSLGSCARQQYYRITDDFVTTDVANTSWQSLLGYAGQAIIAEALAEMGYTVLDQEKTVKYYDVVGHIDGKLLGGDLGDKTAIWDAKVRSAWGYRALLKGLPEGDGAMYIQQQIYIAAENADLGIVTVVPSDLSTNRSLMKQYKIEGNPRVNRIIIYPDPDALELIDMRIGMLEFAIENRITPAREADPDKGKFPCSFCPYLNLCIIEGESDYKVTPLPESWGR